MKIGILGTRGIPNQYGGFEELAEQLSRRLVIKGHDVWVFAPVSKKAVSKQVNGAHLFEISIPRWLPGAVQTLLYDYRSLVRASKQEFDVILECGYGFSPMLLFFRKELRQRIVTNMDGMEWQRPKWGFVARKFLQLSERLAVKYSHILVTDHPQIERYYSKKYGCASSLISYGVDIQANTSSMPPFSNTKGYLLVVSRPEPDNSLAEILDAFKLSSCMRPLILVGNFTNRFGQKLQNEYASSRVIFMGGIYDKVTLNQLRKESLLYLHGHQVGGTNPALLEAMACGCRIVARNNVYNREVLGEGAAYFETVLDLVGVFNHIDEYVSTLNGRIEENIAVIQNHYQWDIVAEKYEQLFLSVIANQAGSTSD